jgi:hypothetical protein
MATLVQIQIFELAKYEHPEEIDKYPLFLDAIRRQKALLSKIIDMFWKEEHADGKSTIQTTIRG